MSRLFVVPPRRVYDELDASYLGQPGTYATYNYLGGGPAARVKRSHFEAALRAVRTELGTTAVLDVGCADGVFLPSLSAHFPTVVGIDVDPEFVALATAVVERLQLSNVRVVKSPGRLSDLADDLRPLEARLAFCLETVEHVGEADRLYASKLDFLDEIFELLTPGARVVITVPTMVGLPFLVQRAALAGLRLYREPISPAELARAVVARDTDSLEPRWTPRDHLGFNHLKLETAMGARFRVLVSRSLVFSHLFVIARQP